MRHPIEDAPYVPPTCPTEHWGNIPDLSAASFMLLIDLWPDRPGRTTRNVLSPRYWRRWGSDS